MDSKDTNWRPRHLLIGDDDSEGAKDAVRLARALCAPGAELLLEPAERSEAAVAGTA